MRYLRGLMARLSFVLPMVALLLMVEFYLAFDRVESSYYSTIKQEHSILVIANSNITQEQILSKVGIKLEIKELKRQEVVKEILSTIPKAEASSIAQIMPYFYSLQLQELVDTAQLKEIKSSLEAMPQIKAAEIFLQSYRSNYRLFGFVGLLFDVALFVMFVIGFMLMVKQMHIWRYEHIERMQVMDIFGATLQQRSMQLFNIGAFGAIVAVAIVSVLFAYLRFFSNFGQEISEFLLDRSLIFAFSDIVALVFAALVVVVVSVAIVSLGRLNLHQE